jgi:hypothetical protein
MATGDAVRTVVNALRPLRIDGEENRRVTPWWAPVIDLFWWLVLSFVANALLSALGAQAEDAWVALPVFAAGMTLISRFGRISMGTAARHRKAAAVVGVIALALVVYGQTVLIEPPAHRYSGPVRAATAVLGSLIAVYAFATVTHLPDWRCSYRKPRPRWSGGMLVFVEDAAEAVASSYVEADQLVWVGDRRGQWVSRPCVRDALVWAVFVVETFELVEGVE